ncbi:MAG: serine hydrolase [Alphaproteobacteria bacterium]|nr:serine hydrolase [Alphaproteobacteria bacterium]
MAIDWNGVSETIARVEKSGCTIGLAAVAPSGERFAHNGDRRFVAASTIKIAIMIELFRKIDAGKLTLGQVHKLKPEDKSTGGGVVLHLHDGIEMTLGDHVYLMMSISDNTSTNVLIDYTAMDAVNAAMRSLGMASSTLNRKMRGRPPISGEQENWAVPNEFAAMIAAILGEKAASPSSCQQMIALLEKQQNDRRIARHLPKENRPRWGTKTGTLPGAVNDVGFVMTPKGPVILSVYVEKATDTLAGEEILGDIARAALKAAG